MPRILNTPAVLCTALLLGSIQLQSQQPGVQSLVERELQRREMLTQYAQQAIEKGAEAMQRQDFESAFSYYKSAVDSLPADGEATEGVRDYALDGFCRAAVSLARQRISEGRYEDARTIVDLVLSRRYNPDYGPAKRLADQLRDPDRFNRALTPQFIADIEEVKRLLIEADGYYQSGRYDLAMRRYDQVLNVDPYNIAARRGQERVNNQRARYATSAYNESRGSMLAEVEEAWALPVQQFDMGIATIIDQPPIDIRGTTQINRKLDQIIIPRIEFTDATIREAIEFIQQRAAQLDDTETDPARRGVNIVLKLDPEARAAEALTRITLSLTQVPLREALTYVAGAAGLKLKVEPYAVAIVPLDEPTDVLLTKEYRVPPSFITGLSSPDGAAAPITQEVFATRAGAREFLEQQGVDFPEGANATYLPTTSRLIVRNTQPNLDLIDNLVEIALATPPTQVEIQSKFLEVNQTNLKELGFDWLLGQFAMPFGSGVYGSGGTLGNQGAFQGGLYPFQDASGTPIGANPVNDTGQLTAGNRTGATAIRANALDGLLFGTPIGPAPGVLAVAGVFTDPQFQVVIRALNQSKGIDLMSAPTVTTQSGQRATIAVVREFIYPTEYDPPQVPQDQGGFSVQPAVPATPSQWGMKPVGVELQVEPTIGPDRYTIDLNLRPRVVEFEGFINYGSPIETVAPVQAIIDGGLGLLPVGTQRIVLTENTINQPVFSVREVETNVTVFDGATVVLGGLMREDVQKVEDKTPILGDIPIAGRLFRSTASQHVKRNLIMFVTANLIDPAGQPLAPAFDDDAFDLIPSEDLLLDEAIADDPASIMLPQP